jgi:hypothetical protein
MKTLITALTLSLSAAFSFAQDNSAKIIEAYGQAEYDQMSISNPGRVTLLNKFVEYGLEIKDTDPKYNSQVELSEIKLRSKVESSIPVSDFIQDFNSSDFNPLEYSFLPGNETKVYRLAGTNKILIIHSQQSILSK